MTKDELLHQMHEKYFDLVWYARSNPKDHPDWDDTPAEIMKKAFDAQDRIEAQHYEEVEELKNDDSNWTHGFNSGMLAAMRLIMCAEEFGTEQALELFPELDT